MTAELESAGELVTAGLVAREIAGDAGKAPVAHAGTRCANCDTRLAGPYCHQCGQAAHVHRSLLHIAEEAIHGILHFDSKSWRTIPLLIARPGLLTRRYIDGQRARYVSPLAFFLFSVFLMFFVYSMLPGSGMGAGSINEQQLRETIGEATREVDDARKLVAQRTADVTKASTPDEREEAAERLRDAQIELRTNEIALAALATVSTSRADGVPGSRLSASYAATSAVLEKIELDRTHPTLARLIRHAGENPDLTLYKLKNSAHKLAFTLVPLSLPFLWLMFFWRKDVGLYDHAIFSLYSLSFMSLWFVLIGLLSQSRATDGLVGFMMLAPPVHVFMHLKETYGLGRRSTLWRTFTLTIAAGLIFLLFLALLVYISMR